MTAVMIYMTTENVEEAKALARSLVEKRLIACANILPPMTSVYRWENSIAEEAEVGVILKSRRELVADIAAHVEAQHSYDCPCVVAMDICDGHQPFIDWIASETDGPA